jgi:tRNA threonylcarbamoyladenosine biosynthesis protein TsaE
MRVETSLALCCGWMGIVVDMAVIVESSTFLADDAATLAFAAEFAKTLVAPCTIALMGDLGAGKTTFVRGVLRALGVTGAIKSPTYALVETYATSIGDVHHFDAYRLDGCEDFQSRGGFDYFNDASVRFIEWPEKLDGAVTIDITVRLDFEGEGRRIVIARGGQ